VNGYRGSSDDLMTRAYLSASRGPDQYPTRIVMSLDVVESYIRGAAQMLMPTPRDSTTAAFVEHVAKAIMSGGYAHLGPLRFLDATVEFDRDIPPGRMDFYIGDELVAELSGWTA
jgi:hypothetical protein